MENRFSFHIGDLKSIFSQYRDKNHQLSINMEDGQRIINQYQDWTTDYQSVLRKDNRLSISIEEGQPITNQYWGRTTDYHSTLRRTIQHREKTINCWSVTKIDIRLSINIEDGKLIINHHWGRTDQQWEGTIDSKSASRNEIDYQLASRKDNR